jgi:hypothetical protein
MTSRTRWPAILVPVALLVAVLFWQWTAFPPMTDPRIPQILESAIRGLPDIRPGSPPVPLSRRSLTPQQGRPRPEAAEWPPATLERLAASGLVVLQDSGVEQTGCAPSRLLCLGRSYQSAIGAAVPKIRGGHATVELVYVSRRSDGWINYQWYSFDLTRDREQWQVVSHRLLEGT